MPEHLRALVVILGVALITFWLAKRPLCPHIIAKPSYERDRNLWLAVTLIAFISHSYSVYAALVVVLLAVKTSRHENPIALYCLLLFAVPPFLVEVPGIGPIGHIIAVDHYRLLNLSILLPLAFKVHRMRVERVQVHRLIDFFAISFLLWMFFIQALNDSITGTLRAGSYMIIDIGLPYYTASRALHQIRDFRHVAAAFIVASVIVGVLAVFETSRSWLLYESLRAPLGVPEALPMYLTRGEGGPLRANVSLGNAIALGYVLMVALSMLAFLFPDLRPMWKRTVACFGIVGGLIASLSRGPWVGAATLLFAYTVMGPNLAKRLRWLLVVVAVFMSVSLLSPLGNTVVAYLPFIGTVELESIVYRQRLLDNSLIVFMQNPLIGDFYYEQDPLMEELRQGQGIIDVVNTFAQVALPYGAVGLFLFVGVFISAMGLVWQVRRRVRPHDPDAERLGRALVAGLLGICATIATVSSISAIPTVYWLVAGLCASYARVFSADDVTSEPRNRPGAHSGIVTEPRGSSSDG